MIAASDVERQIGQAYHVQRLYHDTGQVTGHCRGTILRVATPQEYREQLMEIGIEGDGGISNGWAKFFYEVAVD